jgi:hypothetical protein
VINSFFASINRPDADNSARSHSPNSHRISFRSPSDGAAIVMALAMRVLPLVEPPGVRPLHRLPRRKLTIGAGQEGVADAELDAADPRFGRQQGL